MTAAHYDPCAGRVSGDVVALGGAGDRTFGALCSDVQRAASLLPAARAADGDGVGDRQSVLIACTDRYAFAVALLATWSRGHAAALPASHRPKALTEVAETPGVIATLHDGEAEHGIDLRAVLGADVDSDADGGAAQSQLATLAASAHAVTLYTSGSTGAQQPVHKRADQLLGEVEVLTRCFGADLQRVLCTLPPRHIYGLLFGLLLPLRAGGAFLRDTPLHTDAILDLVRRFDVDTLVGVPAHLQGLETVSKRACGTLRRVFSSGAPLRAATFDLLCDQLELAVTEVLGSTESGGIGYRDRANQPFRPFDDVRVAAGPDGALWLRSPRLAPELPQPHACDDRIELLDSGAFIHLGRTDDVVKVGGSRVSLAAIEPGVRALPGIRDVALIARNVPGARNQEILLAAAGEGWDAARMRAALAEWLDPVVLPRRYRFVSELPRESTGKLRREALLALFEAARSPGSFEWGEREQDGHRVRIELRAPADLGYFRGHFPEWPVLPGVVQLGVLAVAEALAVWPDLGALRRVRRLKFKQPIAPEQDVALVLVRLPDSRVDFTIEHDGTMCSSGSLIFAAPVTG